MVSVKEAIRGLLEDVGQGVKVYDDGTPPVALTGRVLDHWPGKSEYATYHWLITVGPVINTNAEIGALGSFIKLYDESVQIDVWVMEKRGSTYAAEKTRSDLIQDVDRCLFHFATNPGLGFKVLNLANWRDIDEPGVKRSSATAIMLYEKART